MKECASKWTFMVLIVTLELTHAGNSTARGSNF